MKTKLIVICSMIVLLGLISWLALNPKQSTENNQAGNRNLIIKRDGIITIADRELGLQGDPNFKRIEYLHGIKCFLLERTDQSGETQQQWISAERGLIREVYRTAQGKAYRGYDSVSEIGIDEAGKIENIVLKLPSAQQ